MDISYDSEEVIKKCYKCDEHVISNLNVNNNSSSSAFTLWNKFQIFVYENFEFEYVSKVIVPEFQIHNLISSNNYLMCLDCTGNIHTAPLKFKNATQKKFKYGFLPRDHAIVASELFNEDHAICLKYESDAYFLSVHKINTEFSLQKRAIVIVSDSIPLPQDKEKCILKTYPITDKHTEIVKNVFKTEDISIRNNYSIVVICLDGLCIYSCLFSTKMTSEEACLVKLYTCPAEIASMDIIELDNINIVIGLKIGTVICLNLMDIKVPEIIHLNTAIYKMLVFKDNLLYTDGVTMWKAEHILSKDVKFCQLFVKDVKDFVKFGDQIICTTFKNLIYTFSIDDERSFINPRTVNEYCSAENLLNNTEYLKKIMEEIKNNERLIELQTKERDYITALSLSNRQDVMDQIINQKIIVYESYEDAISENSDVLLTNNVSEYFDSESFYFLIKINSTSEHRLLKVLSNSIGNLRFHITLTSKSRIIKTTTVKCTDILKKITLLVPLKTKFINIANMRVHTKIMTNMPGSLDPKQKLWTILYRKTVLLNSEHFIRFNFNKNKIICLQESKEPLEKIILQIANDQYGSLFDYINTTEDRPLLKKWQLYVRLPDQFQEVLKNDTTRQRIASKKVNYFLQQFTSEDFLKSKSKLSMSIAKEKVKIEINNDGFSKPTLKISSYNPQIALDIRNFLSNLIYWMFADFQQGKEFISHSFYITVENLQKVIRECVDSASDEDILPLIDQFERKVIGCLPI